LAVAGLAGVVAALLLVALHARRHGEPDADEALRTLHLAVARETRRRGGRVLGVRELHVAAVGGDRLRPLRGPVRREERVLHLLGVRLLLVLLVVALGAGGLVRHLARLEGLALLPLLHVAVGALEALVHVG